MKAAFLCVLLAASVSMVATSVGQTPADGSQLEPVTLHYEVTMQMGDRTNSYHFIREFETAESGTDRLWRSIDNVHVGSGTAIDTFEVAFDDLRPLRRASKNPGGTITVLYSDSLISGDVYSRGEHMNVHAPLDAPVMGDGAGFAMLLAVLPLATGYETTVRTFDLMQQVAQETEVVVESEETTEVPAGTFESYRLTTEAEGEERVIYVTKSVPHFDLAGSIERPQGTISYELTDISYR